LHSKVADSEAEIRIERTNKIRKWIKKQKGSNLSNSEDCREKG